MWKLFDYKNMPFNRPIFINGVMSDGSIINKLVVIRADECLDYLTDEYSPAAISLEDDNMIMCISTNNYCQGEIIIKEYHEIIRPCG